MDTIDTLAELAFASRLKRLSDRLMKDVSQVYKHLEIDFDARWFAMLYTLYHESPQSITKLAESLSVTHTAVNQLSSELIKNGLINQFRIENTGKDTMYFALGGHPGFNCPFTNGMGRTDYEYVFPEKMNLDRI